MTRAEIARIARRHTDVAGQLDLFALPVPERRDFFRPGHTYDNGKWTFTCRELDGPYALGTVQWHDGHDMPVNVLYDNTQWSAFAWIETKGK